MYQALTADRIDGVIDAIYDSAVHADGLGWMLGRLAGLFDAVFVDSYACTHDRTRRRGVVHGLDAADYQELMLDSWAQRNVWAAKAPVQASGEVKSTREMVSKAELLRSEMYADFLHPRGLHEGMRLSVWTGETGIEDVSILRPWSAGAFDRDEMALGRMLLPHLQRAALVRRRLQQAEVTAQAGMHAIDALHHPVLLLDRGGSPVFVNAAAEALLRLQDGLSLSSGRLEGATAALTSQLDGLLRRAGGLDRRALTGSLRLARPSGAPALAAVVMPLRSQLDWTLAHCPATMLCIGMPGVAEPAGRFESASPGEGGPRIGTLQLAFGLTATEAALAADLLAGHDVARIAVRTGRSLATIRTHLARLMAKTDTSRQTDLLRLMTALPRDRRR